MGCFMGRAIIGKRAGVSMNRHRARIMPADMHSLGNEFDPLLITGVLMMLSMAGWLIGQLLGRRRREEANDESAKRITDASLALMGLLLGFTFAMALGKHDRRRE